MKGFPNLLVNKFIGIYINSLSFINNTKAVKTAYLLFSQPQNGRLDNLKLPKILQESQKETINHNGHTIQTYTWKGNETVILLAHGWESNSARWHKMLPFLKKSGSTVIAFDAPAHGLSSGKEFDIYKYADFIHAVSQKFKPTYLIGHSLGGYASLYYQSVYQNQHLKKITILGTPSDLKIILNNFFDSFSLNNKVIKGFEDFLNVNFKFKVDEFSGMLFAAKINTQGLIAHDLYDETVLFEEGKKIASSWKNAVFIETKGIGHSMQNNNFYKKIYPLIFQSNI